LILYRCLGGALLALGIVSVAFAQDEMPKNAPPAPKASSPAAPPPSDDSSALPPGTMIDQPVAMLQALDKITARVRRLPIKVGQTVNFGSLSVQVDACRKAPPEDPPESAAFLKITDGKSDTPRVVFSGWMFSSSPALSAMDDPVYDIWVIDCASEIASAPAAAPTPSATPH
jgi:hypothetical protein